MSIREKETKNESMHMSRTKGIIVKKALLYILLLCNFSFANEIEQLQSKCDSGNARHQS